jgi:hypothetical protein
MILPEYLHQKIENEADDDAQDNGRGEGKIEPESRSGDPDITGELAEPWNISPQHEDEPQEKNDDSQEDEYASELSHGKDLYTT